jgi:hypothetical protein
MVHGFSQQASVDYDEKFSPSVKLAMIHIVLSNAAARAQPLY